MCLFGKNFIWDSIRLSHDVWNTSFKIFLKFRFKFRLSWRNIIASKNPLLTVWKLLTLLWLITGRSVFIVSWHLSKGWGLAVIHKMWLLNETIWEKNNKIYLFCLYQQNAFKTVFELYFVISLRLNAWHDSHRDSSFCV